MKSILDPSFRYTSSVNTDVRKTFNKVRRAMRLQSPPEPATPVPDNDPQRQLPLPFDGVLA
jgi:hypothetical protein